MPPNFNPIFHTTFSISNITSLFDHMTSDMSTSVSNILVQPMSHGPYTETSNCQRKSLQKDKCIPVLLLELYFHKQHTVSVMLHYKAAATQKRYTHHVQADTGSTRCMHDAMIWHLLTY